MADKDIEFWIGAELRTQYFNDKWKEVEHFVKMKEEERRRRFLDYF